MKIPIQILRDDAKVPAYAYPGDAGMDLVSCDEGVLKPFERRIIHCGFAIAIPEGYGGFVLPRSGLGSKYGITLPNAPGLIDSNYRGEVMLPLINLDPNNEFEYRKGDRIAQLVIMKAEHVSFVPVESMEETTRGQSGFGSSGYE